MRSGALDCTGATRLGMADAIPAAVAAAARRRNDIAAGQESLFGAVMGNGGGDAPGMVELDPPIGLREMPRDELLAAEKEALGLYVSSHPLQDCRQQLPRAVSCGLASLADRADNETVTVGGIIGALKNISTRRGERDSYAPGHPLNLLWDALSGESGRWWLSS